MTRFAQHVNTYDGDLRTFFTDLFRIMNEQGFQVKNRNVHMFRTLKPLNDERTELIDRLRN